MSNPPEAPMKLDRDHALQGVTAHTRAFVEDAKLTDEQFMAVVGWVSEAEARVWAEQQAPKQTLHQELRESEDLRKRAEQRLADTLAELEALRAEDSFKSGAASRDKEVRKLKALADALARDIFYCRDRDSALSDFQEALEALRHG